MKNKEKDTFDKLRRVDPETVIDHVFALYVDGTCRHATTILRVNEYIKSCGWNNYAQVYRAYEDAKRNQ